MLREVQRSDRRSVRHAAPRPSFLLQGGLPAEAAPFLNFCAFHGSQLQRYVDAVPAKHFPIGHTGGGDVIAVCCLTGEVIYIDHDHGNCRVLINSSLPEFAESLCLLAEHHASQGRFSDCLERIRSVAPAAA